MTTEFRFLAASVILGLVHLIADSHLISFQYGYRWTASNRENPARPLRGLAHRVDQAFANFMETFPFFAAVGGGIVSGECLRLRLADEVRYSILPIVTGDGIRFFENLERDISLHLTEIKAYKSGMVALRYEIQESAA